MKTNLSTWIIVLLFNLILLTGVQAQKSVMREYHGQEARTILPEAVYLQEGRQTIYPAFVKLDESSEILESEFFTWLKQSLKTNNQVDFVHIKSEKDELGFTHSRYLQTFMGVPVDKSTYILHTKEGLVKSFNGIALDLKGTLNPNPALKEQEALQNALSHYKADTYMWEDAFWENELKERKGPDATHFPKGLLVWYETKEPLIRLAWKFDIYAASPHGGYRYYIDAQNGSVLHVMNLEHNCTGASVNSIFNGNRSINTELYTATEYRLKDDCQAATIRVRDWNSATTTASPIEIDNTTNTWTTMDERFGATVLWEIKQSYLYFLNVHGRASTDNANGIIEAYINAIFSCSTCPGGVTANNASMGNDGITMKVGLSNAGTLANSYATVDIIGHEYAHAVTRFSGGLIYQDESGALNESFSDIFGEVIERYVLGTNDWLLGSERTNGAIRDMSNPNAFNDPDTYGGTNWCDYTNAGLNCTMNDNGGVHINSGVQNFWYYLLVAGGSGTNDNSDDYSVSAIGNTAARAIAYRNLTVYLGPNSTFADARTGSINAAADLFGACSNEVKQVMNAWYAVGVGGPGFDVEAVVTSNYKGRHVSCHDACDGTATASVAGGFLPVYTWSNSATSQSITNLCPGTYTVTVTNLLGLGCSETSSITILNTPELLVPALTLSNYNGYNVSCFGGSNGTATANPSGGTAPYSYQWSNSQTTATATGLSAGTYTVTVTDGNGCVTTRSATLTQPPLLSTSAAPTTNYNGYNVRCFGGNDGAAAAIPAGGVPPYSYSWNDGQTTNPATSLYAQTYTVTVTDDNGCTTSASTTLTEPPQLTIDAGENDLVYFGYPDSACTTLSASGIGGGVPPYILTWSTGSHANDIEVCPMTTTVYYLTVLDANDCMMTDSVKVCVLDVRCGLALDKVIICHPTGSMTTPYQTLCVSLVSAVNHIGLHPGEQLAACGTDKSCEFNEVIKLSEQDMASLAEGESFLNAYPNPFTGNATVQFMVPDEQMAQIKLVDYTGREVLNLFEGITDPGYVYEVTLSADNLKDGIYLLVLQTADGIIQTHRVAMTE
jgi:Zn-dependent metalloprotease